MTDGLSDNKFEDLCKKVKETAPGEIVMFTRIWKRKVNESGVYLPTLGVFKSITMEPEIKTYGNGRIRFEQSFLLKPARKIGNVIIPIWEPKLKSYSLSRQLTEWYVGKETIADVLEGREEFKPYADLVRQFR